MGQMEIEPHLNNMPSKRHVSASTQASALNAIAFLYSSVLKIDMPDLDKIVIIKHILHSKDD